ncbi:MAG TPA: ABC transporter permease [Anaerolineales bacterium]|nr:ABC transporter permease [Anaerolineales bacterium]
MTEIAGPQLPAITELNVRGRSPWQEAWGRFLRNKASLGGLVIVIFFMLVTVFASVIAPHSPLQLHSGKSFLPPAWVEKSTTGKTGDQQFLLGTDTLGRDALSRVLYGSRVSMMVGFVPTVIIILVGTLVGMVAGYYGGTWDNFLMRLTDIMYGFPDLLFFIIVLIALRDTWIGELMSGLFLLFFALAIVNWVSVARLVRGQVLSLKEKEFVEAARSIGVKDSRIMLRHLLPNILGPLIVLTAFQIPNLIILEAILGYLGLGLKPATNPDAFFITSWGSLLLEGQTAINAQPFLLLAPAVCVALVVVAFTFIGDGLRDALDPRMRGTQ